MGVWILPVTGAKSSPKVHPAPTPPLEHAQALGQADPDLPRDPDAPQLCSSTPTPAARRTRGRSPSTPQSPSRAKSAAGNSCPPVSLMTQQRRPLAESHPRTPPTTPTKPRTSWHCRDPVHPVLSATDQGLRAGTSVTGLSLGSCMAGQSWHLGHSCKHPGTRAEYKRGFQSGDTGTPRNIATTPPEYAELTGAEAHSHVVGMALSTRPEALMKPARPHCLSSSQEIHVPGMITQSQPTASQQRVASPTTHSAICQSTKLPLTQPASSCFTTRCN